MCRYDDIPIGEINEKSEMTHLVGNCTMDYQNEFAAQIRRTYTYVRQKYCFALLTFHANGTVHWINV